MSTNGKSYEVSDRLVLRPRWLVVGQEARVDGNAGGGGAEGGRRPTGDPAPPGEFTSSFSPDPAAGRTGL